MSERLIFSSPNSHRFPDPGHPFGVFSIPCRKGLGCAQFVTFRLLTRMVLISSSYCTATVRERRDSQFLHTFSLLAALTNYAICLRILRVHSLFMHLFWSVS